MIRRGWQDREVINCVDLGYPMPMHGILITDALEFKAPGLALTLIARPCLGLAAILTRAGECAFSNDDLVALRDWADRQIQNVPKEDTHG